MAYRHKQAIVIIAVAAALGGTVDILEAQSQRGSWWSQDFRVENSDWVYNELFINGKLQQCQIEIRLDSKDKKSIVTFAILSKGSYALSLVDDIAITNPLKKMYGWSPKNSFNVIIISALSDVEDRLNRMGIDIDTNFNNSSINAKGVPADDRTLRIDLPKEQSFLMKRLFESKALVIIVAGVVSAKYELPGFSYASKIARSLCDTAQARFMKK